MAKAIVMHETGAADVLHFEDVAVGPPGPGELRIRQTAIGVNFHDVHVRTGLDKTLTPPGIPGAEAIGEVIATGPDALGFKSGGRVAYIDPSYGAYATERKLPATLAAPVPDGLDDVAAASIFLKGLTACPSGRQS